MKHQINSFKVAFRGIWFAIKSESHIRFHLIAGMYVIIFSFFYNISIEQWGIIILLISSVITAEIFNTALEQLCNLSTESYDPVARIAKDVAAGAVLVLTFAAIAIAVLFYFDIKVISAIISFFLSNPLLLTLFILSLVVSFIFIKLGPMGFSDIYYKLKRKNTPPQ